MFDVSSLRIAIDTRDALTAKTNLDNLDKSVNKLDNTASKVSRGFLNFKSAVAGIATGVTVAKYIELSDVFTNMSSRLKLATSTTQEFYTAQRELYEMAQRSRVSFADTVDLYGKLAVSTKSLRVSQEDLLNVTEAINQAGIIGGGTKESINAALIQLGQGLASGVLRGEELNSVLEQTPRLARAIAEGMNVEVGELRSLAEQGMITNKVVVDSIKSQVDKLKSEYSSMTPTVEQSMMMINNAQLRAVGTMEKMTGLSGDLAGAMRLLAKGIDEATTAYEHYYLINTRIQNIRKIDDKELLKDALDLIKEELYFLEQSNDIRARTYRLMKGETSIQYEINQLRAKELAYKRQIREVDGTNVEQERLKNIELQKKSLAEVNKVLSDPVIDKYNSSMNEINAKAQRWAEDNVPINLILEARNKLINELNENSKHLQDKQKEEIKLAGELERQLDTLATTYIDLARIGMNEYEQGLYGIALQTQKWIESGVSINDALEKQAILVQQLNEEMAKSETEANNTRMRDRLEGMRAEYDLKEKQIGLLDDENEKNRQLAILYNERQKKELESKLKMGEISTELYNDSLDYEDKLLSKSLNRYSETGQIIEAVGNTMESSMMDFFDHTSKGFMDMKSLANNVLNSILQQMIKMSIVNPLVQGATSWAGGLFANAQGGVYSSPSLSNYSNQVHSSPKLFAFAQGGVPNMGVFGEAGSEAIMPLTRTPDGDLGVRALGTKESQNVKVEIINQSGEKMEVTNARSRNDIEGQIISIVINAINTNKGGLRTAMGGR